MKKHVLLNAFAFLLFLASYAQSVPQGMNYQAVARDNNGQIMANQKISLKISLITQADNKVSGHYTEIHEITTNELGLFTLIVGQGKTESGSFKAVPWSSQDIWMQVSIKDR